MTVTLSEPIQVALSAQNGEPLKLLDPRTQATYVLVSEAMYDRLRSLVYDDSMPSIEERQRHWEESGKRQVGTNPRWTYTIITMRTGRRCYESKPWRRDFWAFTRILRPTTPLTPRSPA